MNKLDINNTNGLLLAYCGIEGANAAVTAARYFPLARRIPYSDFKTAYDAVQHEECDAALLPLENNYAGEVGIVTDLIHHGKLIINGVIEAKISHALLGTPDSSLKTVTEVMSHPMALEQCDLYIKRHKLKTKARPNTAMAAQEVAELQDKTVAAIANEEAAALYGLKVLARDINTLSNNVTKFAILVKADLRVINMDCRQLETETLESQEGEDVYILSFVVRDERGALVEALAVPAEFGYNLRVIRSRPDKSASNQYVFYAEIEGNLLSENGCKMLKAMRKHCTTLKPIGRYRQS